MTSVLEGIRFLDVEEGIVIPDDQIRVQVETRDLDPKALEFLPEETINKLKEEVK